MLLITPTEVITIAFTAREHISAPSIRPIKIDVAQEHYIRPRFGDQFFDRMCEGEYTDFVDRFIKPALAQYVRYGVIDELTIQMSDNGAIMYGSENQESAGSESSDGTQNETKTQTDKTDSLATEIKTDSQNEKSKKTDQIDKETYFDKTIVDFPSENGTQTTTIADDRTTTLSTNSTIDRNEQMSRQNQNTATVKSNDQRNENRVTEKLTMATIVERRIICSRALCDANVLLAKAIRYVERNAEQFEFYLPVTISSRHFF